MNNIPDVKEVNDAVALLKLSSEETDYGHLTVPEMHRRDLKFVLRALNGFTPSLETKEGWVPWFTTSLTNDDPYDFSLESNNIMIYCKTEEPIFCSWGIDYWSNSLGNWWRKQFYCKTKEIAEYVSTQFGKLLCQVAMGI